MDFSFLGTPTPSGISAVSPMMASSAVSSSSDAGAASSSSAAAAAAAAAASTSSPAGGVAASMSLPAGLAATLPGFNMDLPGGMDLSAVINAANLPTINTPGYSMRGSGGAGGDDADVEAEGGADEDEVDRTLHPSGIVPVLQNIVATVNLECKLDLKNIALHARNAEYNPKRFAAVIMRIRDPKTTALIFASGKMVVTGAKSEEQSKLAARKYARIVQKLGFRAKFTEFKIQNIVGSCDVKFPIRLEGLSHLHSSFSSYEPELFPGLIYRMARPKIVLLIFVSGKIVLTGAKVREEIYQAFENIYPVLTEFRKDNQ